MEPTTTFATLAPLHRERRALRAFTLVELLVTISIIVLLVGLLVPVVMKSRAAAKKARIAGDLQTISVGLEAYFQDFRDYPRLPPGVASGGTLPNGVWGSQLLCWALIAPGTQAQD